MEIDGISRYPVKDADTVGSPYARTEAEAAARVTIVDHLRKPGIVDRYGANLTPGTTNMSPAIQASVNQRIHGGSPVEFIAGAAYRMDTSVTADDFDGLEIFGNGAVIDFRVSSCLKLGDHTVNPSREYTTLSATARNIIIRSLKFRPTVNGWNGNRFAYLNPIDLSAVENVVVRDCQFEDWDLAAVNIGAPSKHVLIERCSFRESQEGDVCYGVRPFAHVARASTDAYDESDGTLAYDAPTSYHQDILVRDCYFYQCSHAILSWNVHHFAYVNNEFEKPTVRTISVTNWNFDGTIQGNRHIVANNSRATVSTCIAVGIGSQRLLIDREHFEGTMSGSSPNDSLKIVDIAGVNQAITVANCTFDVSNSANLVVIGPNVGATIRANQFIRKAAGSRATIVINDQTASPVHKPGFTQPQIQVLDNTDFASARFIELIGTPPGGTNAAALIVEGNVLKAQLTNGLVATHTNAPGWKVRARNNQFSGGTPTYIVDFGSAKTDFRE